MVIALTEFPYTVPDVVARKPENALRHHSDEISYGQQKILTMRDFCEMILIMKTVLTLLYYEKLETRMEFGIG